MVLLARHAVVEQIFVHLGIDPAAVVEVQRQEALRVHQFGRAGSPAGVSAWKYSDDSLWMKIASGRTFEDRAHRQHVGLDDVLERGDERPIAGQLLVPPAVARRERRADVHLVDRRVELHPGKALGERPRVVGRSAPGNRGSGSCRSSPARRNGTGPRSARCCAASARRRFGRRTPNRTRPTPSQVLWIGGP